MEGGILNTIIKGGHPRTIPARFDLIWFSGFRGKDLNVKVYDVQWTTINDRPQVMAKCAYKTNTIKHLTI